MQSLGTKTIFYLFILFGLVFDNSEYSTNSMSFFGDSGFHPDSTRPASILHKFSPPLGGDGTGTGRNLCLDYIY
jgi:hypothetical protein